MRAIFSALTGRARLRISGHRPERMLNILAREGIAFTRPEREDEQTMLFSVTAAEVKAVRRMAAEAYFDCKLLSRRGLPFFLAGLRLRPALLIMPLLCILAAMVLSLFIWEIEITGSETVSDAEILSALEENGIGPGTFGLTIDRELLRDKVIEAIPRISWMTVNVQGCRAEVIVRERTKAPEVIDPTKPADIIARRTGLITELSVFEGKAMVSRGDTVLAGELIVSGELPSLSGKTRYRRAQGIVKARTWYEISEKIPLEYISKRYTGETKTKKSLIIGNYRLNLYLNGGISLDACDKIIYKERLSLPGGMLLPIETVRCEYREYIAEPAMMSVEDAEAILKAELTGRLREQCPGEPLSLEFATASDGSFVTVTLRAECIEDIGMTVPRP